MWNTAQARNTAQGKRLNKGRPKESAGSGARGWFGARAVGGEALIAAIMNNPRSQSLPEDKDKDKDTPAVLQMLAKQTAQDKKNRGQDNNNNAFTTSRRLFLAFSRPFSDFFANANFFQTPLLPPDTFLSMLLLTWRPFFASRLFFYFFGKDTMIHSSPGSSRR